VTPAQHKYDLDLAASMQKMATWIAPRSRKVADTLRVAADRIRALASEQENIQPASTPDKKR
jgi:hypothetical protein